ncbi:hypothetical protein [Tautonia plasticadhaerens]|uniref:Uncharacterized protein n=1 Tax=Tautonia plasticadhaerens TaxID=2527974 RepID=A0A518GZA2_9BACT|nr:hypothetical protein [Tautonia plasticadhaerens]QDV33928.1 hypothetical protein ElP_18090 [Tautonia plasticadhaerens]
MIRSRDELTGTAGDRPGGRPPGSAEGPGRWARRQARQVVSIYVAVAAAWIVGSDSLLGRLGLESGHSATAALVKGLAFVAVTGLVLLWRLGGSSPAWRPPGATGIGRRSGSASR